MGKYGPSNGTSCAPLNICLERKERHEYKFPHHVDGCAPSVRSGSINMLKKYNDQNPGRLPCYLTESELAKGIKVSKRTLQAQRQQGTGIPFKKFGRSVRYKLQDVLDYLDSNTHASTSD